MRTIEFLAKDQEHYEAMVKEFETAMTSIKKIKNCPSYWASLMLQYLKEEIENDTNPHNEGEWKITDDEEIDDFCY